MKTITEGRVENLKREAKRIKKQTGQRHFEVLEQLAKREGFASWVHLTRCVEKDDTSYYTGRVPSKLDTLLRNPPDNDIPDNDYAELELRVAASLRP